MALRAYHDLISATRRRYAGTPLGATESIFAYQAAALGLDLVTPPALMQAISDGYEPTVADITETLEPATATFQDGQAGQLQALEQALAKGTGQ